MMDRTDASFLAADGFVAADLLGTRAATGQVAIGRGFAKGWLRRADTSVSFGERQTLAGVLQHQDLSIYGSVDTHANVAISGGM